VLLQRLQSFGSERGQTTAEYALVILVAGLVVGVFAAVVKSGAFTDLFEGIVKDLLQRAVG
jgi:hypothetical protein